MNWMTRALATLAGVAVAGVLLWAAAQVGRGSTGGYWAAYAIVAAAGVVLGLSQLRGRGGHPRAMLALCFLPLLVVGGWVLIAAEPHGTWLRDHVLAWSGDLSVDGVVRDVGTWVAVVAFGIGYVLGLALEPAPRRRVVENHEAVETHEAAAADEPIAAERRELEPGTTTTRMPATVEEPARVP